MRLTITQCLLFLAGLLPLTLSSNPDSEPVQDSSSSSGNKSERPRRTPMVNPPTSRIITSIALIRPVMHTEWRTMGQSGFGYSSQYDFREVPPQDRRIDVGSNLRQRGRSSQWSRDDQITERSFPQRGVQVPQRPLTQGGTPIAKRPLFEGYESAGGNIPHVQITENPQTASTGQGEGSGINRNRAPDFRKRPPYRRGGPFGMDTNMMAGMVNDFGFVLVDELKLDSNFVISPLSIFTALAMTYLGAEEQTKQQIEIALGMDEYGVHNERFHQLMRDLESVIKPKAGEYQMFTANGMFLGKNVSVNPQFVSSLRAFYHGDLMALDFSQAESSMEAVNAWVTKKTRGAVTRLLDTPPHALMRLIIANAVYFKGTWDIQFPVGQTEKKKFFGSRRETEVPMMMLKEEDFRMHRSSAQKHTFIRLPYAGDQMSMIIALPFDSKAPPNLRMTDRAFCRIRDSMTQRRVDLLQVPRFRLEHTALLKKPLRQIGVTDLFVPASDLSGIRHQKDLYVSSILHKAVVEVNERGSVAAASTADGLVALVLRNETNFVANHPFSFFILHEESGLILFQGKVFDLDETPELPESANVRNTPNVGGNSRTQLHGSIMYDEDSR